MCYKATSIVIHVNLLPIFYLFSIDFEFNLNDKREINLILRAFCPAFLAIISNGTSRTRNRTSYTVEKNVLIATSKSDRDIIVPPESIAHGYFLFPNRRACGTEFSFPCVTWSLLFRRHLTVMTIRLERITRIFLRLRVRFRRGRRAKIFDACTRLNRAITHHTVAVRLVSRPERRASHYRFARARGLNQVITSRFTGLYLCPHGGGGQNKNIWVKRFQGRWTVQK